MGVPRGEATATMPFPITTISQVWIRGRIQAEKSEETQKPTHGRPLRPVLHQYPHREVFPVDQAGGPQHQRPRVLGLEVLELVGREGRQPIQ